MYFQPSVPDTYDYILYAFESFHGVSMVDVDRDAAAHYLRTICSITHLLVV